LRAPQELTLKAVSVIHKYGFAPLLNLLPFLSLLFCCVFCHTQAPYLVVDNPRFCMLLFGVNFVEMVCGLMLDHMIAHKFKILRSSMVPFYIFAALLGTSYISGRDAEVYLYMYLSGVTAHLAFKLAVVTEEICEALDMWCFDIVTPRGKKVKKR